MTPQSTNGHRDSVDCVVVGAGPAGCTAATLIAMQGHKVTLLERETTPKYKIGESLLPATIHGICPLLGVSEEIKKANFILKHGGTFRWGKNPNPWVFDFASSQKMAGPTSTAYQVERVVFDRILLENARKKGVSVRVGCKVTGTLEEDGRVAGLTFLNEQGDAETIRAKYVVDGAGHESPLARKVGERIFSKYFQNIAVFGYFENGGRLPPPLSGNIFCAAFDEGWFWYIPLRKELTSVGVVIDKSKAGELTNDLPASLARYIEKCKPIKDLLKDATRVTEGIYGEVRARKDYSYANTKFWIPGLALIGDSACFVDPVFSSGVHLATYSGLQVARSVNTYLRGGKANEVAIFDEFEKRYRREYANFYDFLLAFYNVEQEETSYFWEAKKVLGAKTPEDEAFINLVGGVGNNNEELFDAAAFFEQRAELGDTLFPEAAAEPVAPAAGGERGEFYRKLTSEITAMQINSLLGSKRPLEQPLFEDGLVPTRDGMHWAVAAAKA